MKKMLKIVQMKNKVFISSVMLVIILASIVTFFVRSFNNNNYEPNRLPNIPKEAIWKGAADEGFWIDVIDVDPIKRTVRLRVYNDYNGELALDADFLEKSNCIITPFTKDYIRKNIFAFASVSGVENRDEIAMKNSCSLKLIKPAYGGSFKE